MRNSVISIPLLLALAVPVSPAFQPSVPMLRSAEPASGRVGDEVLLRGENLGRNSVAAVYLTDGTTDVKVSILEQTATSIRFRIPPEAKPGRLGVLVLTKDKEPRLIEEPVKITIEPETTTATSAGAPMTTHIP